MLKCLLHAERAKVKAEVGVGRLQVFDVRPLAVKGPIEAAGLLAVLASDPLQTLLASFVVCLFWTAQQHLRGCGDCRQGRHLRIRRHIWWRRDCRRGRRGQLPRRRRLLMLGSRVGDGHNSVGHSP